MYEGKRMFARGVRRVARSAIEWTEETWNPVTGCTKVSSGCQNCYAEKLSLRLRAMGNCRYQNGFKVTLHPDKVDEPIRWSKPRIVFVNSMSDLFHEAIPFDFIKDVFQTMASTPRHTYQVLTKRSGRMLELASKLNWPNNVWMGVSVEDASVLGRVDHLRNVPATVRFLSLEPLLGLVESIDLTGIHWVIAGGESGPNARPMKAHWATSVRDKCIEGGVPFFFKQWGGVHRKRNGCILEGEKWHQMPACHTAD